MLPPIYRTLYVLYRTWLSTLRDQVVSFDFVFLVLGLTSIRVRVYIPHKMQDPVQSTPKSRLQAVHPLAYNLHSSASHSNVKVTQAHDTFCLCALSLRCLSRLDMRTRAAHTQYYCDRTTVHTAHARLLTARWSVSGDSLLYAPRPRQPLCLPASSTSA